MASGMLRPFPVKPRISGQPARSKARVAVLAALVLGLSLGPDGHASAQSPTSGLPDGHAPAQSPSSGLPGDHASAQSPSIGLISALVGEGVVTHSAQAQPSPLQLDALVFLKDRIETRERSVARVLFGGRITVTIREQSIVTITDDPAHPRVELESGKLALKVHRNGLRPGEVAEIYTVNAVTGIRGSLVIAEVEGPTDKPDSHITVLEAHHPITVAARNNPNQVQSLLPGQALTVSGPRHSARFRPLRHITPEHARREAEAAEVPGRPRDGGEEHRYAPRPVRGGPRTARGGPRTARAEPSAAAVPEHSRLAGSERAEREGAPPVRRTGHFRTR
jgi:FecR-like protein